MRRGTWPRRGCWRLGRWGRPRRGAGEMGREALPSFSHSTRRFRPPRFPGPRRGAAFVPMAPFIPLFFFVPSASLFACLAFSSLQGREVLLCSDGTVGRVIEEAFGAVGPGKASERPRGEFAPPSALPPLSFLSIAAPRHHAPPSHPCARSSSRPSPETPALSPAGILPGQPPGRRLCGPRLHGRREVRHAALASYREHTPVSGAAPSPPLASVWMRGAILSLSHTHLVRPLSASLPLLFAPP